MSGSIGCTKVRPCGRWWCSDVNPFEYMQALAQLWGRGGKDLAAAQQDRFFDTLSGMAKAVGAEGALSAVPAAFFDPQGLSQANETFEKLRSAAVDLSGTWNGEYSGAYTGTFVLNWKQTGSKLTGTIELSAPPATLSLNGTITGTTIEFGTVGSAEITYSGTVAGDKMSGTYSVNGSPGGDWSATKSS